MVRRISSSRPITGSSLPSSARLVMSTVYLSSAWRDSSAFGSLTASPPRRLLMAFSSACLLTPWASSSLPRRVPLSSAASSTSSLEMYWSPFCWARRSAWLSRRARSCDMFTSPVGFWIFGRSSSALASAWRRAAMSKPTCISSGRIEPPCCSSRADIRCSGSMALLSRPTASDWASERASCSLLVKRSIRMGSSFASNGGAGSRHPTTPRSAWGFGCRIDEDD
ncbi:hypothetical protein D3C78_1009750 [compost metagenome]